MTVPYFYDPFQVTIVGRVTAISAGGHQVQVLLPAGGQQLQPPVLPGVPPLPPTLPVTDIQTGWVNLNPVDSMTEDTLARVGQSLLGLNCLVTVTFADDTFNKPIFAALLRPQATLTL